ncbi:D-3-phosphoglycerate dehydrogenase [Actinopolymorpha cephalotaxi]|uniref:D-3-phosphoglycerate dehydrogenase n=1 Tax=Actinopolymorpha cephalotaxi TaxID=504797 RepID=A0A1I2LQH3_9ACTN|nr:NAD(P)-dependent oxidoreductase [Actinopolymorpha cephalotaxi]NYH81375.1 phosphoglycerate dehydrogenase-like enzyme [Actinopolymorpha cephalotaxi]SFF80838.1 D-3-phosphoglycerate dehydrogenase [Actinopolymorpha cephalotaxi]
MAFRVGVTRDFRAPDGRIGWGDIGLSALEQAPGVEWEFLPDAPDGRDGRDELPAEVVAGYDALLVLTPRVSAASLTRADRLRIVARFGVGYDNVDVAACTDAGVLVTITPDGVRRPVAVSALTLLLALTHRVRAKDQLVRAGRWQDKLDHLGVGVTGRTLGVVGWGNIGQEVSRVCAPLGMRQVAADPYADASAAAKAGVELLDLDDLLTRSDFVVLTCALTPQTRGLIAAGRLARMKESAFLVNVARGPVVDQQALTRALAERRIAGAALDVFDPEPPAPDDPLLALDNVLLAPHAIAWTDELALGNGRSAVQAILDVAAGRRPTHVVNPQAWAPSVPSEGADR